jgi:hypothetical protein
MLRVALGTVTGLRSKYTITLIFIAVTELYSGACRVTCGPRDGDEAKVQV